MKFRGWHVEGFGVFCDYRLADLPGGLVLVHGPNEAGKSTLLAFLRGILFGFPDRRGSEPMYLPLRGGRHGGALFLENTDGIYRVERLGSRRGPLAVVRPDGSEGGEDDLQRLLGGADRQLFKTVFAFSLQELAGMETLSSDQVRARIFSAGIAGAGRSARDVIDGLQHEAGSLLSPRAGRIRELVREAQSLSDRIAAAVRQATDYTEALRREEVAALEVGRLRKELDCAEVHGRRATTLIELWPTESERQEATKSLDALPAVDSFPADPEERLAAALSEVRTTKRSVEDKEQSLQRFLEKRRGIELDDRLPGIAATAMDLVRDCAVHRDRSTRIVELAGDLRQHEGRVAEVLRDLGPGWTEAVLTSFDASLPAAEEVRHWKQRVELAKHNAGVAASTLMTFQPQLAVVEDALGRIAADLDGPVDAPTEDWVRALSSRLTAVAENISVLDARAPGLILDPLPLERAAGALAAARQDSARLGTIQGEATGRLEKIVVNEALISIHDRVQETARHLEVERQRLRDIEKLEVTWKDRQEVVERSLRELGEGWTQTRATAIPTDFAQLQQAREHASRLVEDRDRVIATSREVDHVGKGRSAREKDMQRLAGELAAPEPISIDALEKQNRSFRRLRTRLREFAQLEGERSAEERVRKEVAVDEPVKIDIGWLRWVPLGLGAIAVVLAFFTAWRFLVHDAAGGGGIAVACLLAALLAFGFRLASARVHPSNDSTARRQDREKEARRRIEELERRIAEIEVAITEDARFLGLPDLATLDQVEDRQEQWSSEKEARRQRDGLTAAASRLGQELESWRESETRRKGEHAEAKEKAAESERLWELWLTAKSLPAGMTPDAARDLLEQVRSFQGKSAERDAIAERLQGQQKAWQTWKDDAESLLVAGDKTATASAIGSVPLLENVLDLQRRCEEEAARFREKTLLEQEITEWNEKLANAQSGALRTGTEARSAVRTAYERVAAEWRNAEPTRNRKVRMLEEVVEKLEGTTREWDAWQVNHGLERRMSADGVLDFFALVRRGRDENQRREQLRGELDTLHTAVAMWEKRAQEVVSCAGLRAATETPSSLIDAALEVARRCEVDAKARGEAERLDAAVLGSKEEVERAKREYAARTGTLSALFAETGVSNEQEFRDDLAHYRCREALKRKLIELETRIVTVLGRGDEANQVRQELSTGRVDEWRTERSLWSAETDTLRERHEGAIREHQNLSNARRRLEEAGDVADLDLQLQAVRTELDAAVRRHRVTSLAASLVGDTLREFERLRQPAVLANASKAFERITDGRYTRVVQTEDAEGLVVLDRYLARHVVGQLSRGTQEQLYLSMRLGLAREFGQRAVSLPLVMDDVLVNFDEERARRMAKELKVFAETQQVLLFTCHAFVRSMLVDLDPTICVIDLPVYDVAGGEVMGSQHQLAMEVERVETTQFPDLEDDILNALASAGSLSSPEIAERFKSPPEQVRRALSDLREKGLVVMSGQKRGARYALVGPAEV